MQIACTKKAQAIQYHDICKLYNLKYPQMPLSDLLTDQGLTQGQDLESMA